MGGWWFVCDVELCCLCWMFLLRFVWVYEWCISSQVCIVAVVYIYIIICISDEPSVWLHLIVVCFLFVCDRGHNSKCLECVCLCVSSGQDLTRRPPLL